MIHLCSNIIYYFSQTSLILMNSRDDNIIVLLNSFECINLDIYKFVLLVDFYLFV